MMKIMAPARVLLTGASGFVGSSLYPDLTRAGFSVLGLTRDVAKAEAHWPDRCWVGGSLDDAGSIRAALAGCRAAYYLVHSMGEGTEDYRRREHEEAVRFARAAAESGVERIVYLGGIDPRGERSEHLASRLEVGRILRDGPVPTLELRAGMIVGTGSLSWRIVRDLAARLPVMVLPRWLKSRMQPVGIDDVVHALTAGLSLDLAESASYDLPGPETMTCLEALNRAAECLGLRRPVTVSVPFLSPWISSQWLRLITRAEWPVARELISGLTHDLLARGSEYWSLIRHTDLLSFDDAARRAIDREPDSRMTPIEERIESLIRGLRGAS